MSVHARVSSSRSAIQSQKHLDELLDEALQETFPASDPLAMLELAPDRKPAKRGKRKHRSTPESVDARSAP